MEQQTGLAYVEFWRQFKDDPPSNDDAGARTDLIDAMSGDERAQAALHLLARFRRAPRADRRIVQALGYLRVTAAAPLLEELARERTAIGVEALLALWRLDGLSERVVALVGALERTISGRVRRWLIGADAVRIAAAAALGSVDTPLSRAALARAAGDPDAAVSFNARVSLRRLRGEGTIQASVAEAEDLI